MNDPWMIHALSMDDCGITHGLSMDYLWTINYSVDLCPRVHFRICRASMARPFFSYGSIFLISSFGVMNMLCVLA